MKTRIIATFETKAGIRIKAFTNPGKLYQYANKIKAIRVYERGYICVPYITPDGILTWIIDGSRITGNELYGI